MQITDVALIIFILICCYTDLTSRKVYNLAVIPAIILGLGFNYWLTGFAGLKDSALGMLLGMVFLILFYILGGMGAGDVKFLMAVGSLKGSSFVSLSFGYGAIFGAAGAIVVLLTRAKLMPVLKEIFTGLFVFFTSKTKESLIFGNKDSVKLPYTVFLSLGVLARYIEIILKQ